MRSLIQTLETQFPSWRTLRTHECSPGGAASQKLAREGQSYSASYWFDNVPSGTMVDGRRSEDLARLSFDSESIDLLITQDVVEHLLEPEKAFREIARVLRPGGAHVFTVPWWPTRESIIRARLGDDGTTTHLLEPEYHRDCDGAVLVATEWGSDFPAYVEQVADTPTSVVTYDDRRIGVVGLLADTFVSRRS